MHEDSSRETSAGDYHGTLEPRREFEATVRNTGAKDIVGIGWRYEYRFTPSGAEPAWLTATFETKVRLQPGRRTKLRDVLEGYGEGDVAREVMGKHRDIRPTHERVVITVVKYADGTRWQNE